MPPRSDAPVALAGQGDSNPLPSLQQHLLPEALWAQHGAAIRQAQQYPVYRDLSDLPPAQMVSECAWAIGELRKHLDTRVSLETLQAVSTALEQAVQAPVDQDVILGAVGLMLDARSRQPPNPEVYFRAMVYDLADEGFPPAVIVAACQRARRTLKYLPEVAEMVDLCRKVAADYHAQLYAAQRAIKARRGAEAVLESFSTMSAKATAEIAQASST